MWDYAWAAISIVFLSIPLGLSLWALLDAAHRPGWAWALARRSQAGWMAAVLCGTLMVLPGMVISLWYLFRIRPTIAAAESGDIA